MSQLFDTVANAINPQFNDPNNLSGLSTAATFRREVSIATAVLANGGAITPGQTQAVRTATLNAINNAIAYAIANNYAIRCEPGTYEIYGSSGISLSTSTQSGAVVEWRGSINAVFIQFYLNAPIMTISSLTGASVLDRAVIDGMTLNYGVSQTGQTSANALNIGPCFRCIFRNIAISTNYGALLPLNPPYIGINIPYLAGATFFQNAIHDCEIGGGQLNLVNIGMQGTGNLWSDIYTHAGSNAGGEPLAGRGVLTGPAWVIGNNSYAGGSDQTFIRVNIEATCAPCMVSLIEAYNCTWIGTHMEGIQINAPLQSSETGPDSKSFSGCVWDIQQGQTSIESLGIYELAMTCGAMAWQPSTNYAVGNQVYNGLTFYQCTTAGTSANSGGPTGTGTNIHDGTAIWSSVQVQAAIFSVGSGNDVTKVTGLNVAWNYTDSILPPKTPLVASLNSADNSSTFEVAGMSVIDSTGVSANLVLDATANNDGCPNGLVLAGYCWDANRPRTRQYRLPVTSNYVFYGHHQDATLLVPAALSANLTITLSQYGRAADTGANAELTPTSSVVHMRRQSAGSASHTLTVVDQKSGATLTTNTVGGTDLFYQFNGTNWAALS